MVDYLILFSLDQKKFVGNAVITMSSMKDKMVKSSLTKKVAMICYFHFLVYSVA